MISLYYEMNINELSHCFYVYTMTCFFMMLYSNDYKNACMSCDYEKDFMMFNKNIFL